MADVDIECLFVTSSLTAPLYVPRGRASVADHGYSRIALETLAQTRGEHRPIAADHNAPQRSRSRRLSAPWWLSRGQGKAQGRAHI